MNDETILLVGHGARDPEGAGNREVEEFAAEWRRRHPQAEVQVCFIEYAEVLLEEGLDRAAASARRVLVLPLILNAAGHAKVEIPEAIAAARLRHPGVEFRYGHHLGCTDPLLELLRLRLHQALAELEMADPRTTGVVLLARGASDREATGEVAKMARWLFETTDHELVEVAFTGISFPRLETAVQRLDRLGASQIVVLPYYLFTGRLIERIRGQVARLRGQYPTRAFALAGYLGRHEKLFELLDRRLEECRAGQAPMPCDGCAFAEAAAHHHHHHH